LQKEAAAAALFFRSMLTPFGFAQSFCYRLFFGDAKLISEHVDPTPIIKISCCFAAF
jgi:hypothetical protein